MGRTLRLAGTAVFGFILLIAVTLLLNPTARQLAPIYLYYDLIGRRIAPVPPEIEQFVLQSGQDYCAVGRDSDCGGFRLVAVRALPVDQAAQQSSTAAWCIDYVVLRRNQGRMTSGMIYWANIAKAMIVARAGDGRFESSNVADCRTATIE
jgi:hypothetical protein